MSLLLSSISYFLSCCVSEINTLRPRQNGRHFADDIFKCIFLNENVWILIKTSMKFVPRGPVNNILALVQIMACRRPGDKPLSETMVLSLLTHICITRPQWVKSTINSQWDEALAGLLCLAIVLSHKGQMHMGSQPLSCLIHLQKDLFQFLSSLFVEMTHYVQHD